MPVVMSTLIHVTIDSVWMKLSLQLFDVSAKQAIDYVSALGENRSQNGDTVDTVALKKQRPGETFTIRYKTGYIYYSNSDSNPVAPNPSLPIAFNGNSLFSW